MRIASWPGYGFSHNPFMAIFLDGLAGAGAEIISCDSIEALLAAEAHTDAVILHWAETLFWQSQGRRQMLRNLWRMQRYLTSRRPNGPKRIWLAHNLIPHTPRPLQRRLWPRYIRALSRGVDGVLTLSPATIPVVRGALPDLALTPMDYVWHPRYPAPRQAAAQSRAAARADLGLAEDIHVFGHCGQLRRYKGTDLSVAAFEQTQNPKYRLYMAGKPTELSLKDTIQAAANRDPRIILDLQDLSGRDFETALMRCDTVLAPFRTYLHSGSLVHALSLGRCVLTPTSPFAQSLADAVGPSAVVTYDGPLTPDLLDAQAHGSKDRPAPDLSVLDPARGARRVLDFIDSL